MEFLRTPDPSAAWLATPRSNAPNTATPPTNAASNTQAPTPGAPVDRAGIKSSFQQLFTPNVGAAQGNAATPFFARTPHPSGLTPFLNGGATPNLVTPALGMMPMATPMKSDGRNGTPDVLMSSPYLQAAAKEAVRREFMNMPSYIAGPVASSPTSASGSAEQTVPPGELAQRAQQAQIVYTKDGQLVPSSAVPSPSSTTGSAPSSEARVPGTRSPTTSNPKSCTSPGNQRVPQTSSSPDPAADEATKKNPPDTAAAPPSQQQAAQSAPMVTFAQRPFYPGMPAPGMAPPQGMFFMPPNAQMMIQPPPHNAVFMHPSNGMMMFAPPGAAPPQLMPAPPGMMMHAMPPPHMAHAPAVAGPPTVGMPPLNANTKAETATERKDRIEREKQELIREFKKKTREAALVRFRQKRRERRFGKLIRYECRKQLADARPRVKGRFVRIKTSDAQEDSECAQVVPSM